MVRRSFALVAALTASAHALEPPMIRVLGTAQDGGIPHAACACANCESARSDPARRRLIASLALVTEGARPAGATPGPAERPHRVTLIDCTPDIREQLERLRDVRDDPRGRVDRAPFDALLLTHAHIGHYLGLAFLGFEAISAPGIPAYCTPRMADYLTNNGPWSQLVEQENIALRRVTPGTPFDLEGLSITPIAVPHRDEFSDTVAFRIRGPAHTVLYIPDCAPWRKWRAPFPDPTSIFDGVDIALVDGCFHSVDELPGRHIEAIGHPLMVETMDLLQDRVTAASLAVYFTHMNHSNAALDPASDARRAVESRGFHLMQEGQVIDLK